MKDALIEILQTVASSVLGLDAVPQADPCLSARTTIARALVGCVQISGAWTGALLLCAAPAFADLAARTMLDGAASEADQRDALGELANMIAGNLKPLLAAPSFLSLPVVGSGRELAIQVSRSRVLENVDLDIAGHRIAVTLLCEDVR